MKLSAKIRRGLCASVLFSLPCSLLAGCSPQKEEPSVPDHLIGVWTTTHPAYVDRSMEISSDRLLFETGEGSFTVHRILSVTAAASGERTRYVIRYSHQGKMIEMSLYHRPPGTIIFKNQPHVVWGRSPRPTADAGRSREQ